MLKENNLGFAIYAHDRTRPPIRLELVEGDTAHIKVTETPDDLTDAAIPKFIIDPSGHIRRDSSDTTVLAKEFPTRPNEKIYILTTAGRALFQVDCVML